ncbi:MAG: HAMP domain-containing sensor histidine kinase [Solirubrobacteraceae bacterium]
MTAASEETEQQGRSRDSRTLSARELVVESVAGVLFLAAAIPLAILGASETPWRWDVGVALVIVYAIAVRTRFDIGPDYTPPTQLVFVPMLLVVAPQYAPLIGLAGALLGWAPSVLRGRRHPSWLLVEPANCWFAIGPALVLTIAGTTGPNWGDWPVYALALAAQLAGDLAAGAARERAIVGATPHVEPRALAYIWSIDVALAPIGLLAAFASQDGRFAFLGVLPLVWLLAILSRERTRRFEAERAGTRAREALLAGASHELQTPLAVLSGLVDTLATSPRLSEGRRAATYETMQRQTALLRHLVGQFVDYARFKAGQELLVSVRPTDVAATLRSVGELWTRSGVTVPLDTEEVTALADPNRLHSVVMTLVGNAVKYGPANGPVTLACCQQGPRAVIEVRDRGPGISEKRMVSVFDEFDPIAKRSEGSGIGLFLARAGLRAQGGDVRLRNDPAGGLVATVYLPVRP